MSERHYLIKTMAMFIEQLMDDAAKVIENREIFATLYSLRPLVEKSEKLGLIHRLPLSNDGYHVGQDEYQYRLHKVELHISHRHGSIICQFIILDEDWISYIHRVKTLLEGLRVFRADFRDGDTVTLAEVITAFESYYHCVSFVANSPQLNVKRGEHNYMFHIVE